MEPQENTPKSWYKKKRYIAILVFLGLIVISNIGNNDVLIQPSTQVVTPIVSQQIDKQVIPLQTIKIQEKQVSTINSKLSNDNYYTNTAGNKVHSPAYSNIVPIGASAQCRDGTYSFSQSRRGTCSHHGGVAKWL